MNESARLRLREAHAERTAADRVRNDGLCTSEGRERLRKKMWEEIEEKGREPHKWEKPSHCTKSTEKWGMGDGTGQLAAMENPRSFPSLKKKI